MLVKYLIIRFSSIGDIVLTTPVIRCLKKQVDGAEIHYLTKKQFAPILSSNPYIDKIHILNNSLSETIQQLKFEHFDYIIDLHKNLRSFFVKSRLRIMSFSVDKINFQKWMIVNLKINRLPDKHIVDRYLETVSLFDVTNDGEGLDYFIPPDDKVDLDILPEPHKKGYIAVVVGGKHITKQITTEQLIQLCQDIRYPIILLGGSEDYQIGHQITQEAGKDILNACGKFNINQSASLVKNSRLVITPDTGVMHIAAAFKKIIISVWGNTIPELGMAPYLPDPESRIFEVKGLSCRPCSKIGFKKCPKKHFRCMKEIQIHEIVALTNKILGHSVSQG